MDRVHMDAACDCANPYDCLYTDEAYAESRPSYVLVWIMSAALLALVWGMWATW